MRRGVPYPFAGMSNHCLPGDYVERTVLVLDADHPFQHDCELIELGRLAGLEPSLRTAHVGDAGAGRFRGDSSDIFVNEFRLVAGGLNARGLRDECGHLDRLSASREIPFGR